MEKAFAYVCAPEVEGVKSQRNLKSYCRKIYEMGYIPICPQLEFHQFLNRDNSEEQQAIREMSEKILKRCRMLVVCGKEKTDGMLMEKAVANGNHIICTTLEGLLELRENMGDEEG